MKGESGERWRMVRDQPPSLDTGLLKSNQVTWRTALECLLGLAAGPGMSIIRLCCKNSGAGETGSSRQVACRYSASQSEDVPDELDLPKDVAFRQPPHLAFLDHV
jgi:hypothetical protein